MIAINERSTGAFTVTFTDESGGNIDISSVVSCRFQLSDANGAVINNRTFENGLMTSPVIVLTGDDLVTNGRDAVRVLTVAIVYNSSAGDGLTATEELKFKVRNLINM